jgi:hypothetical protein
MLLAVVFLAGCSDPEKTRPVVLLSMFFIEEREKIAVSPIREEGE